MQYIHSGSGALCVLLSYHAALQPHPIPGLPLRDSLLKRRRQRPDIPGAIPPTAVIIVVPVTVLELLLIIYTEAQLLPLRQMDLVAVMLKVGVGAGEGAPECGLLQGGEAFCAETEVVGTWAWGCILATVISLELDALGGGRAEVCFSVRGLWWL